MTILIFMIVYYNLKRKNRAQSAMEETDSLLKDFRPWEKVWEYRKNKN